jgi:aspartyl-tRNA(Asn)/glutamyl-tRNA(Gln) amidotransferase subunit B
MPEPYTIVIGLEVHVQLLTRTKLFCGCSTEFGLPPNSATCPVCLGLPGALPVMNRTAFELALKAALALNGRIAPVTKWDRKNYFYPDLPKNFQISQYDLPLSSGGWLDIEARKVRLIRIHLEEDAGKLVHEERMSKVDLNRAGTPLLEIVSEPDIRTPEEAVNYLQELRLLLRELGISDCEMQEGSLRCDANVNLHIPDERGSPQREQGGRSESVAGAAGSYRATPIVEVKNMNSIRAVERALKYEAERQFEQFRQDGQQLGDVPKATAGWDDALGVTRIQRRKEETSDYRYFPEPDLLPVIVDEAWLDRVRSTLGELPAAQRNRLQSQFGLSAYDSRVLSGQGREVVAYFEEVAKICGDAKSASNWVTNEVLASLNSSLPSPGFAGEGQGVRANIAEFPITAAKLAGLITEVKVAGLNKQLARQVFEHMLSHGNDAAAAIAALGFKAVSDESELRSIVLRGIAANPQAVIDYKNGKLKAADRIKGFVMKETKGLANTDSVQRLLEEELTRQ